MSFGTRLRELRLQENLLLKDIAELLNVKIATVSAWEKDINEPDIKTIKALASYFKVTTDYILDFSEYEYSFTYEHSERKISTKKD